MWMPGTTEADASLLNQAQERRRGSIGWLGVFVSLGLAVGGALARFSDSVVALVSGLALAVSIVLLNWTRLWLRESREPFPYTFSVDEFEPRTAAGDEETMATLGWLSRDLIANLGDRVQRLSLFEPSAEEVGPDRGTSHVHITGWYGIRKAAKGDRGDATLRWQLEIVPQVRLGDSRAPAKLGQIVRYDLGEGDDSDSPPPLSRDQYNSAFERVYWSVASQIYAQIGQAVEEKIELLPPGRLRAAAYLYEADDYATSNTLDAYAAARSLYRKARELYDVTAREEPATRWRRLWRSLREWVAGVAHKVRLRTAEASRRAARREVLTARAELGEARMQISEWHLKLLCGSFPDEIFAVVPLAEKAIGRLEKLPDDVEEKDETLFRGKLTLALAKQLLHDEAGAEECLEQTKGCHPMLARKDAEYFFVSGLNERARLRSKRLFGQAVELAPAMERAKYHRALRSDKVWRGRPTFEAKVALTVDEEYQAVVTIDPGNIAAWANRGYMAWLLAKGPGTKEWRDRAFLSLEAGRQYKEVRSEAVVAELDWNLARLAAEAGDFPKAYGHYVNAVSAQLGDTPFPLGDYFYDNAGDALVDRFRSYRDLVTKKAKAVPKSERRLANAVRAFVLNDCGLAFEFYRARSGDEQARAWAIDAFEDAIAIGDSFILPAYNLAGLHQQLWEATSPEQGMAAEGHLVKAADLLADVLRREPDWTPAQQLMVNVQAELGAMLTAEIRRLEDEDKVAGAAPIVPGLLGGEAPGPDSARLAMLPELEKRSRDCQEELVRQLRRMLPHSCFSVDAAAANGATPPPPGHRIDAQGTYVRALVADETIRWREEFTEFHVIALIEWARALAAEPATAEPALELCRHLRDTYYRADPRLLIAHSRAAYAVKADDAAAAAAAQDVIADCEKLLEDRARRILADDPAHHGMLSGTIFEWLPPDEKKDLLFKAQSAGPSPLTMLSIGNWLLRMGEPAEARKVLESAAEKGGPSVTPGAFLTLGEIHRDEEDTEAALEAFRQAASYPDPEIAPNAAMWAIQILAGEQRRAEALELCQEVAALSPQIALQVGSRLEVSPEWQDAARDVYRKTLVENPHDPAAAPAALSLARLLALKGEEAERVLRAAIGTGKAETRAQAQIMLSQLLLDRKSPGTEAEDLLRLVLDSGPPTARDQGVLILAHLLQDRGDEVEARKLFEAAIGSGSSGVSTKAALDLGAILEGKEDVEAAYEAYRMSARSQSWNALEIARSLLERGADQVEIAEQLCRIGADPKSPEPLFAPDCRLFLAGLLVERGELAEAEKEYWGVVDSRDGSVIPDAAMQLGRLFEKTQRKPLDAYLAVVRRVEAPAGLYLVRTLGAELDEEGRFEEAGAVYLEGAKSGPWAALEIGRLLEASKRPERAEPLYRELVEGGESNTAAEANAGLARLTAAAAAPAAA